jgi:hypothetical protein
MKLGTIQNRVGNFMWRLIVRTCNAMTAEHKTIKPEK